MTTSVGNLTLSAAGNVLINTAADNSDITLTPHGTGDVNLAGDTVVVGDSAAATIKSDGAGTLTVTTGGTTILFFLRRWNKQWKYYYY